jgi:hypothetical protein
MDFCDTFRGGDYFGAPIRWCRRWRSSTTGEWLASLRDPLLPGPALSQSHMHHRKAQNIGIYAAPGHGSSAFEKNLLLLPANIQDRPVAGEIPHGRPEFSAPPTRLFRRFCNPWDCRPVFSACPVAAADVDVPAV